MKDWENDLFSQSFFDSEVFHVAGDNNVAVPAGGAYALPVRFDREGVEYGRCSNTKPLKQENKYLYLFVQVEEPRI